VLHQLKVTIYTAKSKAKTLVRNLMKKSQTHLDLITCLNKITERFQREIARSFLWQHLNQKEILRFKGNQRMLISLISMLLSKNEKQLGLYKVLRSHKSLLGLFSASLTKEHQINSKLQKIK